MIATLRKFMIVSEKISTAGPAAPDRNSIRTTELTYLTKCTTDPLLQRNIMIARAEAMTKAAVAFVSDQ
jgi:hypothetical protein